MVVGPSLILVNNKIMHEHAFPYPMAVSAIGVCSSALVARLVVLMDWGTIDPANAKEVSGRAFWSRLCPVGVLHACTLAFGNAVYLYLGVGFVQMMKAFTPVVILCVLYLLKVESPSRNVAASVTVISFGTVVTTSSSPEANLVGLLLILLSEVLLTLVQRRIDNRNLMRAKHSLSAGYLFESFTRYPLCHQLRRVRFESLSSSVCVFLPFFSNGGGGDVGGDDDDGTQVSEAGRLVLTQNLLCNLSFSVLEGQYFLAPLSSAALVAMSFVYELPKAFAAAQESEGRNPLEAIVAAPHLFGLAAALGVVVNYLG
jgi:hypothetical protein